MTNLAAIFRFIKCVQTEERDNFKRCPAGLHTCFKMVFEIRVSGTIDVLVKLHTSLYLLQTCLRSRLYRLTF